jgi:hypothetical protein
MEKKISKGKNIVNIYGISSSVPFSDARIPSKTGKLFFLIVEM